jgi:uncharacterized protein YdeI (YjbR/CyaY-like superfamily)
MKITKTFYAENRKEWRNWLEKNHDKEKDIWLIYYKKQTGKPRVPYDDAVEEALCFGWIDSTVKTIDTEKFAQRFSPRNPKSNWSEPNLYRIRKLISEDKMTPKGLELVKGLHEKKMEIPKDILKALKEDTKVWKNFDRFPEYYKRIRIAFIEGARERPEEFKKRLKYFIKMTSQNKKFGMIK